MMHAHLLEEHVCINIIIYIYISSLLLLYIIVTSYMYCAIMDTVHFAKAKQYRYMAQ